MGDQAAARANAATGIVSIVPEVGTFSYEQVREAAPAAARLPRAQRDDPVPHGSAGLVGQLHGRTGADILIALALGADAVVIGRLAVYGLAAAGEAGVQRTIDLLTRELHTLMILAGIPGLRSVNRDIIARR